jgi:hypothetical protein
MVMSNTPNSVVVRAIGPFFATTALPDAMRNVGYTQQVTAVMKSAPIVYSVVSGALPTGLSFSSSGLISGIPTLLGNSLFTIQASDAAGVTIQQAFNLRVRNLPPEGLISWWRAENNALDSISTNHGVLTNGATFAAGNAGQSFALDGVNDYVHVPDSQLLKPASVTIETWVRFFATNGIRIILAKPLGAGTFDTYGLVLQDGAVLAAICDNSGFGPFLIGPANTATGQWYHLAFTFDDATKLQALYVNGARVATSQSNRSIGYDNRPVLLGQDINNGVFDFPLNGRIDEAAIYNRALTAGEIAAIHDAGIAGKQVQILTPYEQWKQTYLGDPNAPNSGDPDGDGFNNLAEYTADTNPTKAASRLRITGISFTPAGIAFQWQGGMLATQYLQCSFGLSADASWTDVFTNLPPTASPPGFTNSPPINATQFYRLRAVR